MTPRGAGRSQPKPNDEPRRTHVVRILPNEASCLRLIRALAIEIHEDWIEATRYLNMDILEEHKKLMRFNHLDAA